MPIPSFGILPTAVHGLSAAKVLPKAQWVIVRTAQYEDAGWACQWCSKIASESGAARGLECHEEWDFNVETRVARVTGLFALCKLCHLTQHMALARILDLHDTVIKHYAKTNKTTAAKAKKLLQEASDRFKELNEVPWVADLTWVRARYATLPRSKN